MKIIRVAKETRKKRRFSLGVAQWGGGEQVYENKNWKIPPSGLPIQVQFSLSNDEIERWGQRPEWQKSHRVGDDATFAAKIKANGKIDDLAGDFKKGFVGILQSALNLSLKNGSIVPEPTMNNLI